MHKHKPPFLSKLKFPRLKELPIWKAVILFMVGVNAPIFLGALAFIYINYFLLGLLTAWIPYMVWYVLVLYFRRKDRET